MGCCFSGEKDDSNEEVNDRSPLLGGDRTAPIPNNRRSGASQDGGSGSTPLSKTDEQAMLSKILHQTANNVIDVSAVEPHSLERGEYMERSRQYQTKIQSTSTSHLPKGKPLPSGVTAPQQLLASDPVAAADIAFVIKAAKGVEASLQGFQVDKKEDLVVQFGTP